MKSIEIYECFDYLVDKLKTTYPEHDIRRSSGSIIYYIEIAPTKYVSQNFVKNVENILGSGWKLTMKTAYTYLFQTTELECNIRTYKLNKLLSE